jgi:hypothetical protein
VGKNTSRDGVSVGDGVGHNVMGGVDMGIPSSVGKGGVGIGNWGCLNHDLGSLNGLQSGNNMVGIRETGIPEGGGVSVVGGSIDHRGYLTDRVNETILVIIFRITLKGNGLQKIKKKNI